MSNPIYQFGDFTLNAHERSVTRAGEPVPLTPKAFDLLLALLERRGILVEKRELFELVWPNTFVEESNLTYNISMLRKALGDGGWIETLPKRGYRFVGEVTVAPGPGVATPAVNRPSATAKQWLWVVAAAGAVVAVGLWLSLRRGEDGPPAEIRPLTTYAGRENRASLSPDAKRIAFSWDGGQPGNYDLYVLQIGAGAPVRLTNHPGHDLGATWSPDGNTLAFLRYDPVAGRASVLTIPGAGGPERRVADLEYVQPGMTVYSYGSLLSFHPGAQWIAVPDTDRAGVPQGIFAVSLATGAKRRLTTSPGGAAADLGPAFRPDGRFLAFVRASSFAASEVFGLELTSDLRPGSPVRLTSAGRMTISPMWLPEGRELIVLTGGISNLAPWRIDPARGKSRRMEMAPEGITDMSGVARSDGSLTAVFTRDQFDTDIWSIRGDGRFLRVITSTRHDMYPEFSPDGSAIAFLSSRSGPMEVWTCRADGSNPLQITSVGHADGYPRWSPDARKLAFTARPDGHADVFVVGSEGGTPQRLTREPSQDVLPSWSRDGTSIYFRSTRSGRPELWKMRPDGSGPVQMTKQGGELPIGSPDGRFLYYAKSVSKVYAAAWELWRMPAAGGLEERVIGSEHRPTFSFAVAEEGIYFVSSATHTIKLLRFANGRVETAYAPTRPPSFDLSVFPRSLGRARTILYSQIEQEGSDLMLIEKLR